MSKLIRIPYLSLPEVNTLTENYQIRYRLKSDDGNKTSAWSPIYSINPDFLYLQGDLQNYGTLVMQKHTGYVTSTWDAVSIYKNNFFITTLKYYDFWVKYAENSGANPSNWIYRERLSTTSMDENVPATYLDTSNTSRIPKQMFVEIYRPGNPVSRYTDLQISVTQDATNIDIVNDTVSASAHGLITGDPIIYSASATAAGGLETDALYFIRKIDSNTFSLYIYKKDALNNLNKINLSSTGSGVAQFTRYPFLLYKNKVTTL